MSIDLINYIWLVHLTIILEHQISFKLCLLMSFYLEISILDNIFIYETGNITMIHEKRLFLELMMFVILSPPFYRDQIKLPYHN